MNKFKVFFFVLPAEKLTVRQLSYSFCDAGFVLTWAGLADVNVMCTQANGAANVNSGKMGLQSAGIIAHETGHK